VASSLPLEDFVFSAGGGFLFGAGAGYAIKKVMKIAAVLPGANAAIYFDKLVHACEKFAKVEGVSRLVAGVNTGRHEAYRKMISLGFRNEIQGVVMDRPNEPAYNKPEIYLIDDWR